MKRLRMSSTHNSEADLKLVILEKAMPAESAVVFGDIYKVYGLYAKTCLDLGCKRVLLLDSLETPEWLKLRLEHAKIDFYGSSGNRVGSWKDVGGSQGSPLLCKEGVGR